MMSFRLPADAARWWEFLEECRRRWIAEQAALEDDDDEEDGDLPGGEDTYGWEAE